VETAVQRNCNTRQCWRRRKEEQGEKRENEEIKEIETKDAMKHQKHTTKEVNDTKKFNYIKVQ
jgi:hypothetical protein